MIDMFLILDRGVLKTSGFVKAYTVIISEKIDRFRQFPVKIHFFVHNGFRALQRLAFFISINYFTILLFYYFISLLFYFITIILYGILILLVKYLIFLNIEITNEKGELVSNFRTDDLFHFFIAPNFER